MTTLSSEMLLAGIRVRLRLGTKSDPVGSTDERLSE
jgi:hypothetical protein